MSSGAQRCARTHRSFITMRSSPFMTSAMRSGEKDTTTSCASPTPNTRRSLVCSRTLSAPSRIVSACSTSGTSHRGSPSVSVTRTRNAPDSYSRPSSFSGAAPTAELRSSASSVPPTTLMDSGVTRYCGDGGGRGVSRNVK